MSKNRVVAVIPARGGSKGVPGKNLAVVGGMSLVRRAARVASLVSDIDEVYVSTDDVAISAEAREQGATVIDRPSELSGDLASSELALLHALDRIESDGSPVDVLVFMQATSPFVRVADLREALRKVMDEEADSVFSAFETHAFLWEEGPEGATGVNHRHTSRPRRQDRVSQYQESGAFYVMRAGGFRDAAHRFFGRIRHQEVPSRWSLEIDSPDDLDFARSISPAFQDPDVPPLLGPVTALVTDFDGVHTDDQVYVSELGQESVRVSRSDGMGIEMLREAGIPVLILSKERNPVVSQRARKLGVEVIQGADNKSTLLVDWASSRGVPLQAVAYLGNDLNDIECLRLVGAPVVVADAHPAAKAESVHVLSQPGGSGAVRELAEIILKGKK